MSAEDGILPEAELRALLELLSNSDLTELEVERDGLRVRICRDSAPTALATLSAPYAASTHEPAQTSADPIHHLVASPWVGVFHASVAVGDDVSAGQVIGTVEALRMRHQVEAEMAGVVEEVVVSDGHAVEYGQALVRLRTVRD